MSEMDVKERQNLRFHTLARELLDSTKSLLQSDAHLLENFTKEFPTEISAVPSIMF